jgi:hypothetical protein
MGDGGGAPPPCHPCAMTARPGTGLRGGGGGTTDVAAKLSSTREDRACIYLRPLIEATVESQSARRRAGKALGRGSNIRVMEPYPAVPSHGRKPARRRGRDGLSSRDMTWFTARPTQGQARTSRLAGGAWPLMRLPASLSRSRKAALPLASARLVGRTRRQAPSPGVRPASSVAARLCDQALAALRCGVSGDCSLEVKTGEPKIRLSNHEQFPFEAIDSVLRKQRSLLLLKYT